MQLLRSIALTALAALIAPPAHAAPAHTPEQIAAAALRAAPVWDGHNDVPEQLRARRKDVIDGFDFRDTTNTADPALGGLAMATDLARLKQGHVGAQFWSVFVSSDLSEPQAVQATLEQIDLVKRLVARYPESLALATGSDDVVRAMKAGKVASLIGIEGGHQIGGSLGVLRQMAVLGARYMTLTHFKNNAWADSATDAPAHHGLTDFGRSVVREMQRIGMLVDLSHVSEATMLDALAVAKAPVMFSHSSARGLVDHPRNVPDAVLAKLAANGGIAMVNFYPGYDVEAARQWNAARAGEEARQKALHIGDPDAAKAALDAWTKANPLPRGGVRDVADHIDRVIKVAGIDHVGIGGDLDGVEATIAGLDDVSKYPALFTELARRGYTQAQLEKIASGNMLRVLRGAEAYAAAHRGDPPIESATTF